MPDLGTFYRTALADPYAAWDMIGKYPVEDRAPMILTAWVNTVRNVFASQELTPELRRRAAGVMADQYPNGHQMLDYFEYMIDIAFNPSLVSHGEIAEGEFYKTALLMTAAVATAPGFPTERLDEYVAWLVNQPLPSQAM